MQQTNKIKMFTSAFLVILSVVALEISSNSAVALSLMEDGNDGVKNISVAITTAKIEELEQTTEIPGSESEGEQTTNASVVGDLNSGETRGETNLEGATQNQGQTVKVEKSSLRSRARKIDSKNDNDIENFDLSLNSVEPDMDKKQDDLTSQFNADPISVVRSVTDSYLRTKNLTDDLDTWEAPFSIPKDFPYYLTGYDDEGRPIWVFEFGRMDLRSLLEKGPEAAAAMTKYSRQFIYRLHQSVKNQSTEEHPVTEASVLMDFDGAQMRQITYLPNLRFAMKLAQQNFELVADILGTPIIINANFVAEQFINMMKPLFGPAIEKLEVYGSNKSKWIPALRRVFGRKNLAEWYGGEKTFKPVAVYG